MVPVRMADMVWLLRTPYKLFLVQFTSHILQQDRNFP